MTKSRRVMAVIVAALLIAAMILPGLAVKAEAAEEPAEKPKVEVSLVGKIIYNKKNGIYKVPLSEDLKE